MKLTVVLANTHRNRIGIIFENISIGITRRTVQIELTKEQEAAIAPYCVGVDSGKDIFEEISDSWLES